MAEFHENKFVILNQTNPIQAIETTASFNEKAELEIDTLPPIKNQKVMNE